MRTGNCKLVIAISAFFTKTALDLKQILRPVNEHTYYYYDTAHEFQVLEYSVI